MPASGLDPDRLMLVTNSDPDAGPGGREMLYRMNRAVLGDLYGDGLEVFRPDGARAASPGAVVRGHIDGLDGPALDRLVAAVRAGRHGAVFLDGSNLGAAAAALRAHVPGVKIVTFFHNVEARFFWGSLKVRRSPRALAVLVANWRAERAAVRRSDVLVTLSGRDGRELKRLYGRGADAVAPIVLADRLSPGQARERSGARGAYALFVGGAFYANVEGMRWWAREVAPRLDLPTVVVGRGMEALGPELAGAPHVELVGAVDELWPWYRDASLVVAPIFDGSGMKTKVAEALMFGKRVAGTAEAFSGYAPEVVASGWRAQDAAGFAAAVAAARDLPAFDPAMRALYEEHHSPAAARRRMAAILGRRVA